MCKTWGRLTLGVQSHSCNGLKKGVLGAVLGTGFCSNELQCQQSLSHSTRGLKILYYKLKTYIARKIRPQNCILSTFSPRKSQKTFCQLQEGSVHGMVTPLYPSLCMPTSFHINCKISPHGCGECRSWPFIGRFSS